MSHAYIPARVWPNVYLGPSRSRARHVDLAGSDEAAEPKAKVETRRESTRDSNRGWNNPDWWVSHHYEKW